LRVVIANYTIMCSQFPLS